MRWFDSNLFLFIHYTFTIMETKTSAQATLWKPILGYEGSYEVSNDGQVRSLDRVTTRADGRKYQLKGKLCSQAMISRGYTKVTLFKDGKRKLHYVHRLMAVAFFGPSDELVRHLDDDKAHNHIENLAYGSALDNHQDAIRNGKKLMKLIPADVKLVRLLLAFGWSQRHIAEVVGVSLKTISNIALNRKWTWVPSTLVNED